MYLKKELYELIKTDERIFDFIQNSSLDGLWYWDMENPENEWMNARFWKVLGYNPDEMPHKSSAWQGIIDQDDLKVANDNFAKHCEDPNHPYDQIVRYTNKNGSTKWIRCRGLAIRDNTGKPIRMLGAHNDITEFKNAELELIKAKENAEESEAKLNALFSAMSEMVVLHELVFDENGEPVNYRITDCNDAFTIITGITRNYAIGRLSTEVYGTEQPPFFKEYSEVALTGEPCNYETYFQPMDKHFSISVISPKKNQFATVTTDITNRKRTEGTLRESEENLSITLHSIGDGVITTNKFGMIDRMNPVALKLCGWHEDEIPGKPLTEVFNIINAYTREPVPNPVEKVIENGEIVGLANHTVLVAKDGREYQIADSAAPIKDKDGNIKGIVLVFSDVSEKYAAEEERRKSDERFRIAQEMSPDGFTILHPVRDAQNRVIDFTWIYENNAIARLNGTDPQKVVGQRLLELFPGHRDTQFFKAYQQVAESGESITFEEGYAGESMQKQTWLRIVVVPMGENIAVLAQDITDRKQAEEALKNRENLLNKIFDILPIGLWFADANGRLIRGNPAGVKIWGAEPTVSIEEYGVFKARRHPSGNEIEPDDWALAHTIREGVTIGDEQLEIDAFDGKKKIILNYTAPVHDDQGNIQGAIVVNQDITERKKGEDALKAKMDELERFHKLTVGREITMMELKKEVNNLLKKLGEDPKYKIVE